MKLDFSQKNIKIILIALAVILLIAIVIFALKVNWEMKKSGNVRKTDAVEQGQKKVPLAEGRVKETLNEWRESENSKQFNPDNSKGIQKTLEGWAKKENLK